MSVIHRFLAFLARLHVPLIWRLSQAACRASQKRLDIVFPHFMKCGGIRHALKMIHVARAHHLQVMIGCMIGSSLAITAAAHLTPLVDYADLDDHLLIDNDPYEGVRVVNGKLMLPDRPGLGVQSRA